MRLGEAFIEVRPDTKGFRAELQRDVRTLQQALVGGAFLAGAKKATDAASQLEQAVGGTSAVFGESADAVEDWSKRAAEAAGLSERAARELTSQIGGLLKGFGFTEGEAADLSTQLAQLGADLAATFGGNPEDAVIALGAALRGETDPLERFGIALNQTLVNQKAVELGLAATTSAVDQHAKAQATLALITERSADAQGQFAREADTAAGQAAIAAAKSENAAADLGENLLPIYTKLAETVGIVAEAFGALPEPVQTALIVLAGVGALYGPVKLTAEAAGSLATIMRTRLASGLETAGLQGLYLKDNLGKATIGLGTIGVAVGLAAIAFDSYNRSKQEAIQRTEELTSAIERELDGMEGEVDATNLARILEGDLGEALRSAGADLDLFSDAITDNAEQVERLGEFSGVEAATRLGDLSTALDNAGLAGSRLGDELIRLAESGELSDQQLGALLTRLGEQAGSFQTATRETENKAAADEAAGVASDELAPKVGGVTAALQQQVDVYADLLDAVLRQFDANIGYRRSVDEVEDSLADLASLQQEGKAGTEEYSDAVLDAERALLDQAAAAARVAEDTAKANGETLTGKERTEAYRGELARLRDGLAPGSALRKALDSYIATLGAIPSSISTDLILNFPTSQRAARLQDSRFGEARHAAGTEQVFDGDFLVGEAGRPELLRKRGSSVEVIAGSPTPLAGGSDALSADILVALREQYALLAQIAGNTAGPTTGQRLRRTQIMAGVS